jgi:YVTN family beta-propeller protein
MPGAAPDTAPVPGGVDRRRHAIATTIVAALSLFAPAARAIDLATPDPFLTPGDDLQLLIENGRPGARFVALASSTPAAVDTSGLGRLYLAPGTFEALGSGIVGADGTASQQLPPPATLAPGDRLYVQLLEIGDTRVLSNAVAFRLQDAAPGGQRASRALAVTPDGRRAYVVHQVDGSVSVIDARTDTLVRELPVTTGARSVPHRPVDVAVSPDGAHAFVLSATADFMTVIETATDSVVAEVAVPRGSRRVAFDFRGPERYVYVTNETVNAVLVLREIAPGRYARLPDLRTRGRMPGALLVLPDGRLVVGHRVLGELELIDPAAPPASRTLAREAVDGVPQDLSLGADGMIRVATFVLSGQLGIEGFNRVLRVDPATLTVLGNAWEDLGTDYKAVATATGFGAVAATGSGVVLVGDGSDTLLDVVELAPGQPPATPEDVAFVSAPDGSPERLYVLDFFRETIRPVTLTSGPPFELGAEIPLAWSGAPRVPFTAQTSDAEDGLYLFLSVGLVGGDAQQPNRVTCQSCHTDGVSDNLLRGVQVPPMWGLPDTGPWGRTGGRAVLADVVAGAINRHNESGAPPVVENAEALFDAWLAVFDPPESLYLQADGSLGADAAAGRTIFENVGCTECHAAPLFIPPPENPPTIEEGIGTGLAPANVPSLRGAWSSAPYLHDGSRSTLREVLVGDPADGHGLLTAGLTETELRQLIAWLLTL